MGDEQPGNVRRDAGEGFVRPDGSVGEVVYASHGQPARSPTDEPVPVEQQRRATALDHTPDQVGIHPVVVVPEHRYRAVTCAEPGQNLLEAVQVTTRVADEITAQHDEVGVELSHALGDALEPPRRHGGTMV